MKRVALLWSLLAVIVFCSVDAWARPSFRDKSLAAQASQKAAFLAKIGKHEQAVEQLRKAVELNPLIAYKVRLARSLIELDQFLEAQEVLDEAADDATTTWREKAAAKKRTKLAEELAERTPTIAVAVVRPKPAEASVSVTLDGAPFDPEAGPVPVNPGDHAVTAAADGFEEQSYELTVEEKAAETVKIQLKELPGAATDEEEEDDGEGMGKWPAIVAWGIGGVGLGLGVAFGAVSMDQTSTLYDQYDCQDDRCPEEAEDDLNTAKMNGNISTVGFIVAGVGLVTGTILWLVADSDDGEADDEPVVDEDDELDEDDADMGLCVQPLVGPAFVGLTGTF